MTQWKKGNIHDVQVNKLVRYADERGYLTEIFRLDELPNGLKPVMSYISYTEPGVSRGPHEHVHQTDIFTFNGPGNFKLKLWDNRTESPTYGNFMIIFTGADNPCTVTVPPGVVHGYKNISVTERGMVINCPDELFMGEGKKEPVDELRHEDDENSPFKMEE